MNLEQKPVKAYHNHRENQRERILEVAERLFISNGIDMVSISDIARAARITRNTLYEYFPNKQEVVWAIFEKLVKFGQAGFRDKLLQATGNGFQRIENFMLLFVRMLEENPEHLRFIIEFNTLYAREGNPARIRQMWEGYDLLAEIFRQGIADGSIRPDLDPHLASSAMLNLLNAVNSRFALLGNLISEEYGQPVMDIYREICRAFLHGIQSTSSPQENVHEETNV